MKKYINERFSLKVFIVTSLLVVIISFVFVLFFTSRLTQSLRRELINEGTLLAQFFVHNARIGVFIEDHKLIGEAMESVFYKDNVIYVALFNDKGALLLEKSKVDSAIIKTSDAAELKEILTTLNIKKETLYIENSSNFEYWAPILSDRKFLSATFKERAIIGYANILLSKEWLAAEKKQLFFNSAIITSILLSLGFVVTYLSVKRVAKPIKQLMENVELYARGMIPRKLAGHNRDEIGQLAHAFNDMVSTLEKKDKERKQLEEHMIRTQKMEATAVLAGGIAHDFNNLMTAFMGKVTLARHSLESDAVYTKQKLIEAEDVLDHAKQLSQQLLSISKGGAPTDERKTDITALLEKATAFVLSGSSISYTMLKPDNLPVCIVDRGMITQAFHNLLINAVEAMPEGGHISLEVASVEESRRLSANRDSFIKITIKDQGIGMAENNLKNIFTPFYTSKKDGTGLGLFITNSIVEKHNGFMDMESKLGIGSAFYVYLPAVDEPAESLVEKNMDSFNRGNGERVMYMDDDVVIRDNTRELLQKAGYNVELVADGEEAIKRYREAKELEKPFHLVIMDLTIPGGMGGKEAIKELIRIDSEVCSIVASGYLNDPVIEDYRKYGFKGCITKPYSVDELCRVVNDLVNNNRV